VLCALRVLRRGGAQNCAKGRFRSTTISGAISGQYCEDCPAGRWTIYINQDWCNWCTGGQYAPDATHRCKECEPGRYNADYQNVQYDCHACISGKFSNTARTACESCSDGWAVKTNSQHDFDDCMKCGPGRSSLSGKYGCHSCSDGQYSLAQANSICLTCGAGFAAPNNKESCTTCGAGTYQEKAIATGYSCSACEEGRFTSEKHDKADVSTMLEGEALMNEYSCPEESFSDNAKCTDGLSNCCGTGFHNDIPSCKDGKRKSIREQSSSPPPPHTHNTQHTFFRSANPQPDFSNSPTLFHFHLTGSRLRLCRFASTGQIFSVFNVQRQI
jgi:hypothetical protein